jgi:branched-chain amino acid transport system substrate-binding protein
MNRYAFGSYMAVAIAAAAMGGATPASAQEILKLGMSSPTSGAAAAWGIGFEWAARQAAEKINSEGGVTVDGETYHFEIVGYDNGYNATDGARVAQTLLNRDGVKYMSAASAPRRCAPCSRCPNARACCCSPLPGA